MKTNQTQKNIPSDWQLVKLGDFSKIYDGTHQTPEYVESGIPFYSVEHITSNNFTNTKYISEEIYNSEIKRVKIENGDILMTRIGDIGTAKYVDWNPKASFYVTLALIKCNNKVDSRFITFAINSDSFQKEIYGKTIHVAFPNKINLGDISKCSIPIPSLPEQNRIVSVLETWDNAIEKLSKKIEVKKQIKKGLMQDLLTGKKRLKGFSDKWELFTFGNCISSIGDGGTPSRSNPDFFGGNIPWVVISDIKQHIYKTEENLTELGFKKSSSKLWKKGSIILSTGATIGNVGLAMVDVCTKQGITGIEIKENFSNLFIYYWLLTQKNKLISIGHGGTFKDIRPDSIKKLKINIPKSKEEQSAIAQILTTTDKEINILENKLKILKEQKRYLLNNLITGTIRTPEDLKINT